jgi:rSAM/selenodomain-associated transferase 1
MALPSTLLVLAKAPVAGRVKTRLCPPCRPEEAAEIAAAALADTLESVVGCGAERLLLALDGEPGEWLPPGFELVAQRGDGLAERLAAAWSAVDGPCVQIGMDTPQVTPGCLDQALARVASDGSALGPATDGGWWAIGMARPVPAVFRGVPMSGPDTGARQLAALRAHGLEPSLLAEMRDIDTVDDARAVAALIPRSRTATTVATVLAATAS